MYAASLREAGFAVTIVADSVEACSVAVTTLPDVLVVGFDPAVRGDRFDLCTRLGADARTREIPILLTSNGFARADLELATKSGALVLVLELRDVTKLVSAVNGVMAARNRTVLRASLESAPNTRSNRRDKLA
jgi:PleD family two-component response regulator